MYFWEWAEQQPKGTLTRIQRETGVGYNTLMRAKRGEPIAHYETAKTISIATHGAVSIEELCEPAPIAATGTEG
ncbi:MAG: hypothetical protein ACODAG_09915 [Myxococcota bacterium]